ncbi:hypothetical protein QTN47_27265 [Danxiaibacter flavus]|uniref:Uncharacterized protein n=1 Tax=Danxiaibacter flavus TaxID=3049108 RepID=A0ABV3ZMY5_9BACT|nr:hypothetical protein QNM32_27265 [Chitinophagaceae bacterium DXS]
MITLPLDYRGKRYLIHFTAESIPQEQGTNYHVVVYEPTHKLILPKADNEGRLNVWPDDDSLEIGLKREIAKLIQNTFGYPDFNDAPE